MEISAPGHPDPEHRAEEPEGEAAEPPVAREGQRLVGLTGEALLAAVELGFDYRGDVTLLLRDGRTVCGYVFNRDALAAEPFLDILVQGSNARRRLRYCEVDGIVFSGRDMASGRSWEAWVAYYREKKAARERGEDVGTIGLDPAVDPNSLTS